MPVMGALFRSVQYQKNETELVILVTPVLVHGIDPADVTPVPGEKWRDPTNAQLYLLKDLGGEIIPPPAKLNPRPVRRRSTKAPPASTPPAEPSSGK